MNIGFTGTRKGMNATQLQQFKYLLSVLGHRILEFHYGGAAGADHQAVRLAREYGANIFCHPCPGVVRGEMPDDDDNDQWFEVFPPLVRNRHIVESCDLLIAAPETDQEQLRSGTWATVRYARKAGNPVVMLSRGQ